MPLHVIQHKIEVNRPLDEVWGIIVSEDFQLSTRSRFIRDIKSFDEDGKPELHKRYTVVAKILWFKENITHEVVQLSAPNRIGWKTIKASGPLRGGGAFVLSQGQTPDTTIVSFEAETYSNNVLGRSLRPVMDYGAQKIIKHILQRVKKLSEAKVS